MLRKQSSSVLEVLGVSTMQEALLKIESFDDMAEIMRLAGLETSNLIFGKFMFFLYHVGSRENHCVVERQIFHARPYLQESITQLAINTKVKTLSEVDLYMVYTLTK